MSATADDAVERSIFGSSHRSQSFGRGLIDWITANVDSFLPPDEAAVDSTDLLTGGRGRERKAFSELGMILRLTRRVAWLRDEPKIKTLTETWLQMAEQRNIFADIQGRLSLFGDRLIQHVTMKELNPLSPATTVKELQNVVDQGYIDRVERTSWECLDLIFYLEECDIAHSLGTQHDWLKLSSIAKRPNLCRCTDLDLYGITHILFGVARFGAVGPQLAASRLEEKTFEYLRAALALSVSSENYDLAAEFLICRLYCGSADPLDRLIANWLFEAQNATGFVPASGTQKRNNTDDFWQVYHTTVVCLLLVAADSAH